MSVSITTPQNPIKTFDDVVASKGEEWRTFFPYAQEELTDQYISYKNLVRLTKGNATLDQAKLMVRLLKQDSLERPIGGSGIDLFFRIVDFSSYSLSSWLESLVYFDSWLTQNQKKTSFLKMLGFVECCEQSPEDKEKEYKLLDLVKEMLTNEGFIE